MLTTAESVAFAKEKDVQREKRREEQRVVKETHSKASLRTKSVKELRVRRPPSSAHPHRNSQLS